MISGIVIVGGNGSGKTTLGKYLAQLLGCTYMDAEDYFFENSDGDYAASRSKDVVREKLLADMKKNPRFVLTAVNGDMGDEINGWYDLIVYLHAPVDIRVDRVKRRTFEKLGERMLEGGDLYEQEQDFFRFVSSRTMEHVDAWVASMGCLVLHLDGCEGVIDNARQVKAFIDRSR